MLRIAPEKVVQIDEAISFEGGKVIIFGRIIQIFMSDCWLIVIVNIHIAISFIHLFGPAFAPAHERISFLFRGRFSLCGRFRPRSDVSSWEWT